MTKTPDPPAAGSPRPRRRSPGAARALLLDTARRLFSEQGYAGTSTRQIAAMAEVAEPMLFRHFETMARLFDEAMLEPYRRFISDFMDQWREELLQPDEIQVVTRRFVEGLYAMMREHRQLFLALIAAKAFDGAADDLSNTFAESELSRELGRFDEYLRASGAPVPKSLDSAVSFRLVVGAVMAATVLDEWLFPSGGARPADDRIQHELIQFVLYGVLGKRPT